MTVGVDLAIVACANSSVALQLCRVAEACVQLGMSVQFLVDRMHADPGNTRSLYEGPDVPVHVLQSETWRHGPFAYPSAPAMMHLGRLLGPEMDALAPQAVLTHADTSGTFRVVQWWAQSRSVPGIVLQEGVVAERKATHQYGSQTSWLRQLGSSAIRAMQPSLLRLTDLNEYCEYSLVWGEAKRRKLLEKGRDPRAIYVVGNPAFDHITGRYDLTPIDRETLLFAHQPLQDPDADREACRFIIDVCVNRVGCRLLFRPHPRSTLRGAELRDLAVQTRGSPGRVEIADSGVLEDHFERASALLTYYSTSSYYAVVHGLPVVLADWISPQYRLDLGGYDAAIVAAKPSLLEKALREVLYDEQVRQRLYDGGARMIAAHLYRLDGGAAARSAEVIKDLLSQRGGPRS